jgi:hypothetical protein
MRPAVCAFLLPLTGCFLFHGGDSGRCPSDRTVVLGSQEDVSSFAGCTHASGVTIRTGATIDLGPLRELQDISGDLVVGPTVGVEEVALNGLMHVGGAIRVAQNPSLRGLFLPRLEQAGRIAIDGNQQLATIALPRVATVLGAVVLTDNRGLELFEAGQLVTIGHELVISGHPKLTLVQLGKLATAEAVRIEEDPKLPADMIEQLRSKGISP